MLRSNVPRAIRALRHRRGWRQSDLASAAGVSREAISRLERGRMRGVSVATIEKVVVACNASLDITVRWEGAQLDRLVDASHAWFQEQLVGELAGIGWDVRPEVSFNHFGDRGRIDVLALHRAASVLLVGEVKSAIGDLQDTLGTLDVKTRVAPIVARDLGWTGRLVVVPMLAIGLSRSARRIVAAHPSLFDRFQVRGRQARAWLRRPVDGSYGTQPRPTGVLIWLKWPDSHRMTVTAADRVRTTN